MHVQSVLWYALLIVAAGLVYRRLLDRAWTAGLATLLYAVDDAHGHAVGWISNRNALIGATLSLFALWLHDRWRRGGFRAGAFLAPLALALGLLGSELALGVVGYLVAHALVLDPAPRRRRLLVCLPWIAVVLLWALAYRALGHGVSGSGMYIDPVRAPTEFVSTGVARAFVLLASSFAGPPADLYNRLPSLWPAALASVLVLVVIAGVLGAALRRDRVAGFWALGTALSVAPACAVFPEDRLLLLVGVGSMALVARFVRNVGESGAAWSPRVGRAARLAVGALIVIHLAVAPLLLPYRSLVMQRYEARVERARETAFALPRSIKQELVLLDAPDFYFAIMMLLTRISTGHMPSPTLTVVGGLEPTTITRIDDETLDVRPEHGFLSRTFDRIYRDRSHPMRVGEIVHAPGATVRVLEVGPGGEPLAARFSFHWRLESARLVFAKWVDGRYVRVQMPAIGQSLVVGGPSS